MARDEQMKNAEELVKPRNGSRCGRERKAYRKQACRKKSPRSLDELRVMQWPSLTTTMRVAATAELKQRRRLREEEDEEERRMRKT